MTPGEILQSRNPLRDPTPNDLTAKLMVVWVVAAAISVCMSAWYSDPEVFLPAWCVLGLVGSAYVWSERKEK